MLREELDKDHPSSEGTGTPGTGTWYPYAVRDIEHQQTDRPNPELPSPRRLISSISPSVLLRRLIGHKRIPVQVVQSLNHLYSLVYRLTY